MSQNKYDSSTTTQSVLVAFTTLLLQTIPAEEILSAVRLIEDVSDKSIEDDNVTPFILSPGPLGLMASEIMSRLNETALRINKHMEEKAPRILAADGQKA